MSKTTILTIIGWILLIVGWCVIKAAPLVAAIIFFVAFFIFATNIVRLHKENH